MVLTLWKVLKQINWQNGENNHCFYIQTQNVPDFITIPPIFHAYLPVLTIFETCCQDI